LVQGDSITFKVTVPVDNDVGDLKELIHQGGKNGVLSNIDAKDLILLKVHSFRRLNGSFAAHFYMLCRSIKSSKAFLKIHSHSKWATQAFTNWRRRWSSSLNVGPSSLRLRD
jgi:hypothetical protein